MLSVISIIELVNYNLHFSDEFNVDSDLPRRFDVCQAYEFE